MKSLKIVLLIGLFDIFLLYNPGIAQEWGPEIQITNSEYDDRNAVAFRHQDEIWVFWDREIDEEKQIYYRRMDLDGNFIGEEEQLTFSPGFNFSPEIGAITAYYSWNFSSCFVVCWQHLLNDNLDVQFAFIHDNMVSGIYEAFNSDLNESNPCPDLSGGAINNEEEYWVLISAYTDSTILYKRFQWIDDQMVMIGEGSWTRPELVASLSCDYGESIYAGNHFLRMRFVWEEMSFTDTLFFLQEYSDSSGWLDLVTFELDTLIAFNPMLEHYTYYVDRIYFSHIVDDTTRIGYISQNPDPWHVHPGWSSGFTGNMFDPFFTDQWVAVFVSDIYGNNNVLCKDSYQPFGIERISLSENDDINPSCFLPLVYENYVYNIVFWESNRDGNWNIYGRIAYLYVGVEDNTIIQLPRTFSISIHPNPGNAEFKITLDNPVGGEVKANIYDISGRQVTELYHGWPNPGSKSFYWNASGLPSGIYLLQVQNNQSVRTQKIVLLK